MKTVTIPRTIFNENFFSHGLGFLHKAVLVFYL